jgi:hypothetical protein
MSGRDPRNGVGQLAELEDNSDSRARHVSPCPAHRKGTVIVMHAPCLARATPGLREREAVMIST